MKQRLLVMNGQRLLQTEKGGEWHVTKVDKAGAIKPGIYPLTGARPADRSIQYAGVVLHVDGEHVYQQVGREVVAHAASSFAKPPQVGTLADIGYQKAGAVVSPAAARAARGIKR